ncbi:MAG TPA: ABATE domain-containing protein [Solirubrobacteraceae bacterium]|nr:ABATE domain-containing protein [Solirubrobacteraceae bacterium]
MTGETRHGTSAQPGGRQPAPGRLEVVQAFINTHYDLEVDRGADLLPTPAGLARWLAGRGLIEPTADVDRRDLDRALAVRDGLRRAARTAEGLDVLGDAARGAAVELRFDADPPRFVSADGGPAGAIGVLLAITAHAIRAFATRPAPSHSLCSARRARGRGRSTPASRPGPGSSRRSSSTNPPASTRPTPIRTARTRRREPSSRRG